MVECWSWITLAVSRGLAYSYFNSTLISCTSNHYHSIKCQLLCHFTPNSWRCSSHNCYPSFPLLHFLSTARLIEYTNHFVQINDKWYWDNYTTCLVTLSRTCIICLYRNKFVAIFMCTAVDTDNELRLLACRLFNQLARAEKPEVIMLTNVEIIIYCNSY